MVTRARYLRREEAEGEEQRNDVLFFNHLALEIAQIWDVTYLKVKET